LYLTFRKIQPDLTTRTPGSPQVLHPKFCGTFLSGASDPQVFHANIPHANRCANLHVDSVHN
jgi:hypothetical protein